MLDFIRNTGPRGRAAFGSEHRWATPLPPRTIAIGDIHGCARALEALLAAIAPKADDTLVILGDYIDRGSDSRGVIARLLDLGHRCRVKPLMGNHEKLLLDVRAGLVPLHWTTSIGGTATLKSYGAGSDVGQIPSDHVRFMETSRDFVETATHIFLHANYDPELPIPEQPFDTMRWESLHERVPGPHRSGKSVVVGHTAQRDGEILDLGHIKCIDTYCFGGGWLTALDVETSEVWQARKDGTLRRN